MASNSSGVPTWRVVYHQTGVMGAEALSRLGGPTHSIASANYTMDFEVGVIATAIVVELAWQDQASDLDLQVFSPTFCPLGVSIDWPLCFANGYLGDAAGTGSWRDEGGLPSQGNTPTRIQLVASEWQAYGCCDWSAVAWAKATAGTPFDFYATVFYGEAPAEDYTAIPPSQLS